MSFMGTVGSVAQAGQGTVAAPSSVTIATTSSGNYNNSSATHVDECGYTEGTSSGAMTSNARTVDVDVNPMAGAFIGCASLSLEHMQDIQAEQVLHGIWF